MREKTKAFIGILFVVVLFILSSYFVRNNIENIRNFIGSDFNGIIIYVFIAIIAIVIAPIGMMPILPLASNLWGGFYAGILNIVGWSIGSFIVFFLCRKFGKSLVRKFVSVEKITEYESKIPEKDIFLGIILLRMIVPVDILSYALGLFTKVNFKTYAIATVIGITPLAFVLSYLGTVPIYYQLIGFFAIGLFILAVMNYYKKRFGKDVSYK